ncbi:MAG: NADH-quinone oxidoreductase subunit G [Candidatus Nanopelagicales bacterium]
MTTTSNDQSAAATTEVEMVTGTIDGHEVTVPKGTMIIRAAELIGVEVPRFCDHPLLDPVAACRACLIEVEGMPKPQPSCAVPLGDGMVVRTQVTSEVAEKAQAGVMEFLLINHPLDCPVCDKGGECPLQNQAMTTGRGESRFTLKKRTFPKPISISSEILLDRERCVMCQRCTRFADEIAGEPFIELVQRGAQQQIGVGEEPFDSYFSGNTIQICPVGALTSAEYRFRSRPFDLVSVPTTCEHCASGCALRTDYRHEAVMRRPAADDPEVNEEWNCDKGRFSFPYLSLDRLEQPLVRDGDTLRPASWPEALRVAAAGLAAATGRAAVLTGGRLTLEDAYAYSRFARVALHTDDIDLRARATGADETGFLSARIAGTAGPTYHQLEQAPAVLLVAFEPEEESPIVFLRLRKAAKSGTAVMSVAPFASRGLERMSGRLLPVVPGSEAESLQHLPADVLELLGQPGAVIMVGERAAGAPGALQAVTELADRTGAALAWVPRRAGERGAVDVGCLPGLLPGGRPLADPVARREVAGAWGMAADDLPAEPGRSLAEVVAQIQADRTAAAADDEAEPAIAALVVAGVEASDVPDSDEFLAAVGAAPFVVSLETRPSEVTALADVVLPVAVVTEKAGTFVNWEGRRRPFERAFPDASTYSDADVLALLSDHLDLDPAPRTVAELRAEITGLGAWAGTREWQPTPVAATPAQPGPGEAVLASWRLLLDQGVEQEGEPYLAGTRKPSVARISQATAAGIGVSDGEPVRVSTDHGAITLPALITEMADGIVWLPGNSPGSRVSLTLRAAPGDTVRLGRE